MASQAEESLNPRKPGIYYVVDTPHPFLTHGTGLQKGSKFGEMRGLNGNLSAVDGSRNSYHTPGSCQDSGTAVCSPTDTTLAGTILAYSEPNSGLAPITGSSVVFRKREAGWVFSIGSISIGGVLAVDPTVQRIVRNAIDGALSNSPN